MQYKNFITSPRETSFSDKKGFSIYKQGVRSKYPKKAPPLRVQILPAFNPENPADPQGSVPCLVGGQPTAWFGMIQAAKFVGHGTWKEQIPILSLSSFEGKAPCPYLKVLSYCKKNKDWDYLVTKVGSFGKPGFQDAILKPVKSILLLNIVDVDNPGQGVQIGEFNYGVANNLLNLETGLVFQRNLQLDNYPDAASALAMNPMLAYANGDITDPKRAPVFVVELPPAAPGKFGINYVARIEVTNGQVSRRGASDMELSSRYHLDDPESFLDIPTGQDIVDRLVMLLKGHTNANGIDETCMIKEALGDSYRVDTVQAPGAVNTVQGFQLPPEEPAMDPQAAAPVQGTPNGFAPNPAVAAATTAPYTHPAAATAEPHTNPIAATSAPAPQTMAIPGEPQTGSEAALAASLAARMRQQMNLRR